MSVLPTPPGSAVAASSAASGSGAGAKPADVAFSTSTLVSLGAEVATPKRHFGVQEASCQFCLSPEAKRIVVGTPGVQSLDMSSLDFTATPNLMRELSRVENSNTIMLVLVAMRGVQVDVILDGNQLHVHARPSNAVSSGSPQKGASDLMCYHTIVNEQLDLAKVKAVLSSTGTLTIVLPLASQES